MNYLDNSAEVHTIIGHLAIGVNKNSALYGTVNVEPTAVGILREVAIVTLQNVVKIALRLVAVRMVIVAFRFDHRQ